MFSAARGPRETGLSGGEMGPNMFSVAINCAVFLFSCD